MKGSQSSNAHTLSPSDEVRNLVKRILMDLRFRNKLVGTQYLEEAIFCHSCDGDIRNNCFATRHKQMQCRESYQKHDTRLFLLRQMVSHERVSTTNAF